MKQVSVAGKLIALLLSAAFLVACSGSDTKEDEDAAAAAAAAAAARAAQEASAGSAFGLKVTPTSAAPGSTTWPWASVAPIQCVTTWS